MKQKAIINRQPAIRSRKDQTAQEADFTQMFKKILKAMNAPPQDDLSVLKANSRAAKRARAEFRKDVRALGKTISKNFPDYRIETLEQRIKGSIQSNNPGLDRKTLRQPLIKLIPFVKKFDWRDHDIVPYVRYQGDCGSCWAYVATEAFESSAMMERANFNIPIKSTLLPYPVSVEVKYTLDCVRDKNCIGCDGGRHEIAFKYYVNKGIPLEAISSSSYVDHPGHSNLKRGHCNEASGTLIRAKAWGYVHLPPHEVPTTKELKGALLEHGPLAVILGLDGSQDGFRDYGLVSEKGGGEAPVYDSKITWPYALHFVLLIGWDDEKEAWIIQNSWGSKWGYRCQDGLEVVDGRRSENRGFMYIRWGSNDIGQYAAWVQAPVLDIKGMLAKLKNELYFAE